jgi:hypothetical protein
LAVPLRLEPVTPDLDDAIWPMTYGISAGVNRRNPQLLAEVQRILDQEQPIIDAILSSYAVPTVSMNERRDLKSVAAPR